MKKTLVLLCMMSIFISACSNSDTSKNELDSKKDKKSVILYFSKPEMNGTDAVAGASRIISDNEEVLGNTEQLAMWIGDTTNSPTVRIETVSSYPDNHEILVDKATEECSNNMRPELKELDVDLGEYDTLYIGYPIWWGDMPMAMYSFFEQTDLKGKTLFLFSSHGGSGVAGTADSIKKISKDTTVKSDEILSISRDDIVSSKEEVNDWITSLK